MARSTAEDWRRIAAEFPDFAKHLPDRILDHLRFLDGDYGGFKVDRLTHCLQTASRAQRDGRDEEYVVCALLHDIGNSLACYNHADIPAAILKPFVSERNHWMVANHHIFQGYYFFHYFGWDRHARDAVAADPHAAYTAEFCAKYDGPAFDPDYDTLPLEFFAPMLRRVTATPRHQPSYMSRPSPVLVAGRAAIAGMRRLSRMLVARSDSATAAAGRPAMPDHVEKSGA
jgi:predicted HD phosphohydrolase